MKEKIGEHRQSEIVEALTDIAIEKILVMGPEKAGKKVEGIRLMIKEQEQKWSNKKKGCGNKWLNEFNKSVDQVTRVVKKINKKQAQ